MDCLFCGIAEGVIPADIRYQDDRIVAFADRYPQAPVHILIIPRFHIATLNDITPDTAEIVSTMVQTATKLAGDLDLRENGYRLVMNCNADGGQTVFHLHLHLLGGRHLAWPPG